MFSGTVAAWAASNEAGAGETAVLSTTTYSAWALAGAGPYASATTSAPAANGAPAPTASTVPATSQPSPSSPAFGSGTRKPPPYAASTGLRAAAATLIRTWPGPGSGSAVSTTSTASGPPKLLTTTARMSVSLNSWAPRVTRVPANGAGSSRPTNLGRVTLFR